MTQRTADIIGWSILAATLAAYYLLGRGPRHA